MEQVSKGTKEKRGLLLTEPEEELIEAVSAAFAMEFGGGGVPLRGNSERAISFA